MDNRIIILVLLVILFSCSEGKQEENDRFYIVATTGMIADAAATIGGPNVQVDALMGPGIDPHLYKATHGDLEKLRSADLVLYNGLHLEGKMGEVLEKLKRSKAVVAVGENIPEQHLHENPQYNNTFDPHIWFDVALWKMAVEEAGRAMEKYDSTNAHTYRKNIEQYLSTLDSLDSAVSMAISTIPKQQRVLITAHDAFGYFGKAYDIEVRGLQGISTLSEPGVRDIKELVDYIIENNIKAVFIETSVSQRAINAVVEGARQRGFDLQVGGSLFSDAMGAEGTPEGTYPGMVDHNVKTIVEALK